MHNIEIDHGSVRTTVGGKLLVLFVVYLQAAVPRAPDYQINPRMLACVAIVMYSRVGVPDS